MTIAQRSMGLGLRALGLIAGSEAFDRLGVREPAEKILYRATRDGFKAAGAAGRSFKVVRRNGDAVRLRPVGAGLFDLTPTEEQQMLQEAFRDFGDEQLRPVALQADTDCAAPPELLAQAAELGLTMLGVPEELGGAVSERSSVTSVLTTEALAHGDMGLAVAALAPSAVATALSLWGDASQQETYLPAFVGDDVPAAALAIQEPSILFDPFKLSTTARKVDGEFVLEGTKSLVPLATTAELLIVAAQLRERDPGAVPGGARERGRVDQVGAGHGRARRGHRRGSPGGGSRPGPRAAGRRRSRGVRRVHPPRPPGLVRAGRRHRSGRPGLRDPLRQRARRLRRADLKPPGRRLRRLEHRGRARGDAADHLPGGRSRGYGQGLLTRSGARPRALLREGVADRLRGRAARWAATAM